MKLLIPIAGHGDSSNPFVEQAVQYSVAAAHSIYGKGKKDGLHKLLLQGLDITVLGCNDFYSYRNQIEARGLPLAPDVLALIPPFSSITFNTEGSSGTIAGEKCKPEVAKTGLGSSAAMTTAVVAAVLHYLGAVNLSFTAKNLHETLSSSDLDLVHVVAQTAHCIAQGKVGSGFDVSAAVYGSQHYIRFSPAVLSSAQVAVKGQPLEGVITRILEEKWDHEKIKFSLPPLMTLLLGEPGTGGSSTPSMVGAVKQWQTSDPQKSLETWRRLAEANSLLEMQLKALGTFAHEKLEAYKLVIGNCSSHRYEKWLEQAVDPYQEAVIKSLIGARDAMLEIRFHMQQMGQAAGIPIEPESQTRLLDATMNMEGVLLAGVPGAGGFDAIFAVTLGDSSSKVMKAWSSLSVLPMLVREDPRGVCLESSDPRANEISSSISSMHI
ncbi:phosphomevalonate kinase, peroxisomal isoform X1 [Magnolia sinica]|uniref:phosphomevalonate kinase, peroxisomal isoform X1 n=1 Tax=Magnolia sinica TaxID=86752 RepID=UPI0026592DA2|nr:phosphomevalonate kinase, peroxisomal isoform X1 [Magnolia sinica]XP_058103976.1 phosphomevalonate kinase, peroxisomal isoform X1 [Magnolia sinica]XP_058103977.1 phosphomevalonate kinase, peroxisomal isoform X1 [Magnolia sinica]